MVRITPDKWKHFYVGILLGAAVYWPATLYWPLHPLISFVVSIGIIIGVCYGFELFSLLTGKGHYELQDAVAGIIGGCIGITGVLLLKLLF